MKKYLNFILIISFCVAGCYSSSQVRRSDNSAYDNAYSDNYNNTTVSYQTFYDQLQPYGNWINYPQYGYVWQPNVRQGFRPYETGGHLVSTVDGWAWASDYSWGWAPFHYGRWLYDASLGWAWVPGYEWAPAWVTWGQYNDYYAWAPLAPGISISFGNVWRAPSNYWSYVPRNCINYSNLNRYVTRNNYNTNVNNITIINNYNSYNQKDYYHRGPDYNEVQRITRKTINPVSIAATGRPGSTRIVNRKFEVYRPAISADANTNNNSIPRSVRSVNGTRNYEVGTNQPNTNINREIPNTNNGSLRNGNGLSENSAGNQGNNIRESIENTNRQMQQQQLDNKRRLRTQSSVDGQPSLSDNPTRMQQLPQTNQQNDGRRRIITSNPPARQQPAFQSERSIQRPALPARSERIMSQPAPSRIESRPANPVRSVQPVRPGARP